LLNTTCTQAQNLFVSDFGSDGLGSSYIYEFTPGGTRSTFASGLGFPQGLAFDGTGNLFVAGRDIGGGLIYKFTPSGTQSILRYNAGGAQGLAFDSAGHLFVARVGGYIDKYTLGATVTVSTFGRAASNAYGLAFDSTGNLFVTENDFSLLYKFTPAGTRSYSAYGLSLPTGLAFDSAGDLFVANVGVGVTGSGSITEIKPNGTYSIFASGLDQPVGLAFDGAGNLFVADHLSGNIYEFAPDGTRSTFASGLTGPTFIAFWPVPEPSVLALLAIGPTLLVVRCFRKLAA
jgi:sugar lactone lactonase YvrE